MKKGNYSPKVLLLALVALLMPLGTLQAQQLLTGNAPKLPNVLQHDKQARLMTPQQLGKKQMRKARKNVQLADNQMILGHYDSDALCDDNAGLGLTSFPGVIPVATLYSPDQLSFFNGGKIVSIRVGLASSTTVSRVFIIPVTDKGFGTTTEFECNVSAQGWNTVELSTPYEIKADGITSLLVGFDYNQTSSNYPISVVDEGEIADSYFYLTYNGSTSWYNAGLSNYGNLSLQCIVENDNFPDYYMELQDLWSDDYYVKNTVETIPCSFDVRNRGKKTISSGQYSFTVSVDGKEVKTLEGTSDLSKSWETVEFSIPNDNYAIGSHTLTVTTATLNGEAIADADKKTATTKFIIYDKIYPRQKHLLEHFTSNTCTYCPLGTTLLGVLNDLRSDIAWASIHGTLSSSSPDPYDVEQCDTIAAYMQLTGWPGASFNRIPGWNGENVLIGGLGYQAAYHSQVAAALSEVLDAEAEQIPSFCSVEIKSNFDESSRNANITVTGEVAEGFDQLLGSDASLTVYILEDSLVYKQYNNGKWVSNYVHNNVFRQALPSVFGEELKINGTTYENAYSFTIPESWNADRLKIVAFVSRPLESGDITDMYVNNAEMVKLGESTATGINTLSTKAEDGAAYDLSGRRISNTNGLQKGIYIQNGRKVIKH